eukprot:NODE_163_length_2143_cov_355.224928_g131_i0.p1 GENE.NODE_163_length_2143_cov_355.224928_g131_i0~~NODE_163_length_2143_cov_355.224928_g131_i0.p1  ORF type:complete len:648 (-),score=162.09 NODE_163_length_2143_cov_355.224928_g131_i0:146-2089(-)
MSRSGIRSWKRIVVQVGESVLQRDGSPSIGRVAYIVEAASKLVKEQQREAILAFPPSFRASPDLFTQLFAQYGLKCGQGGTAAQVAALLQAGVTPIFHTNADGTDLSQAGSDDGVATLAMESAADLLLLLSGVDGVYSAPPTTKGAYLLDSLTTPDAAVYGPPSCAGRDGMGPKVDAAVRAVRDGRMEVIIANGSTPDVVERVLAGERLGTLVTTHTAGGQSPHDLCERAVQGRRDLMRLTAEQRSDLLTRVSKVLLDRSDEILAANKLDLEDAARTNLDPHLLGRLKLTQAKLTTLSSGIAGIAASADPIGHVIARREVTEGLVLQQETAPLGVLLVIFESRPDALPQVLSLALRSGNALILKGGKEARHSNQCLLDIINQALAPELGDHAFQLIQTREDVAALLSMDAYVNLVIPRGSNELVRSIQQSTKIPVMGHADGICHVYVDSSADLEKAKSLVIDCKTDYPSACNSMETLLLHESLLADGRAEALLAALTSAGVTLYGGPRAVTALQLEPALSLSHEYGTLEACVEIVDGVSEAIDWIARYGSSHTECIVAEDPETVNTFLRLVDSACVFHNTSTRFADGYRFGLGAEVGISTSRIHARGPVGVQGLLTTRWLLRSKNIHTVAQHAAGSWDYTHRPLPIE